MPTRRIDDPGDRAITAFLGLADHAHRQQRERHGGDMAATFMGEGDLVIARGLAAGFRLEAVLMDARRTEPLAVPSEVDVILAGPEVLRVVCGRPQLRDPIGRFVRPPLPSVGDVLADARSVLVTEAVNNPVNMGVIARTAAALGIDALLLDPSSCDPLYRRAVRVSMGQVFVLPHARLRPLPAGLAPLIEAGFEVLALTPAVDAQDLASLRLADHQRVALLVGAEGPGLSPATLSASHRRVAIPMAAGVDSLNVASAVAVACYALREARRPSGAPAPDGSASQ